MKKFFLSLIAMLTIAATASAMSYEQARNEALFLTDKMAYELNLNDAQYEAAYEINLDYLMGVTSQYDVFGTYWERRNLDLSYILYSWQWELFRAADYFFRPLYWNAGYWHFGIYARYPHRSYFYFGRPHFYVTYRGGHSWRMNGDRSYYEGRHNHYRPDRSRDNHFGMRNGWDRGDYRGNHGNGSRNDGNYGRGRSDGNYGRSGNDGNYGRGRSDGNYGNQGERGNRGGGFGVDRGNRGNRNNDDMYGSGSRQNRGGGAIDNQGGGQNNRGGSIERRGGNFGGAQNRGGSIGNQGGASQNRSGSFGNQGGASQNRSGNIGGQYRGGGSGSIGGGAPQTRGGSMGRGSHGGGGGRSNSHGHFGGSRR